MDNCADCTMRGAQSATKLYKQEAVQGTRDAEIHCRNVNHVYTEKISAEFRAEKN